MLRLVQGDSCQREIRICESEILIQSDLRKKRKRIKC